MNSKALIIVLIFVTTTLSVQISDTKISNNRHKLRTSLCNFYNGNFTDAERQHATNLLKGFSYLTDDQIEAMLFYQNFSSPSIQTFLIVAPHAASLIILFIMIPGLACCCARPQKYPVCKKFRKPQGQLYTKVELKWPSYLSILCYLAICIGSAAALAGGPDITNHINNIGCRITALADDTLYGRVSPSNDANFFVGIVPLSSEFTDFQSKYNTFFSQSNTSLNSSQDIRAKQVAIQNQISSQYTSYSNNYYDNAFRLSDGVNYTRIYSQFKTKYYGPQTDSSKILGNIKAQLSSLFSELNAALDPVIDKWLVLQSKGQSTVNSQLANTISSMRNHELQLNKTIENYSYFEKSDYYSAINLSIKVIYGAILGLALLGLISAVVIACCTVVRIRMIIYFTCSFLIFMAFITFSMLIVFGAFLPNVSQACVYIDKKLSTEEGIIDILSKLKFNSSSSLYGKCSNPNGTGDMIEKIDSQFKPSFDSIKLISSYTLKFNDLIPNFQTANFDRPFTESSNLIDEIKMLKKLQFQNTTAINFLKGVANKTFTKDPTLCTNTNNVDGDSWVPSKEIISCRAGTYSQQPCTNLASTITCPQGCYEMYGQLNTPAGDSASYVSRLNSRYGNNCNYAQFIIELQQNWIAPKKNHLTTVVQANLNTIKTNVNNYQTSFNTIQGRLNTFKANLIQNFNSQTNELYGSINGVDCRVIGESLQQLRDSVCVGLLSNIEYNTIMLCLISYGILLLSCFSVCTGVRHYQHLQKMQVKVGYKGVPVSISSNRVIDKFDS